MNGEYEDEPYSGIQDGPMLSRRTSLPDNSRVLDRIRLKRPYPNTPIPEVLSGDGRTEPVAEPSCFGDPPRHVLNSAHVLGTEHLPWQKRPKPNTQVLAGLGILEMPAYDLSMTSHFASSHRRLSEPCIAGRECPQHFGLADQETFDTEGIGTRQGVLSLTTNMEESERSSGPSSPSVFRLPSFSSINSNQAQSKDTAIAGLQQELAHLRNTLSQTRSRCEALERQNLLSERESQLLSEEKNNLKKQSEALTTQIQELTKVREDLQQQILADGAQWRRIMAMSSKLQMQGVEDSRLLREERESWEQERARYEGRIQLLKGRAEQEGDVASSSGGNSGSRSEVEPVELMSSEGLASEVTELRARVRELESLLSSVSQESEQIAITAQSLNEIRQRIASISKLRTTNEAGTPK